MSFMGMGEITQRDFERLDYFMEEYLPNKEEIWLFGTGMYAKAFYEFLKQNKIEIAGFVVTEVEKQSPFSEEPIISIEELKERYKEKKLTVLLTIGEQYYSEVYPKLMFLKENLYLIDRKWKECAVDRAATESIILSVHLVDYCQGMACYGCAVGSPIANKWMYDLENYKRDLKKVKELIGNRISQITLSGGEVFLHPQLVELTEYTRELFPDIPIEFLNNGLLIEKQTDEFWRRLGKCDVHFAWTLYPVIYPDLSRRMEEIKEITGGKVKFNIIGDAGGEDKTSWRLPFTFKKQKTQDRLFCKFHKDNYSVIQMREGKLAVCYAAFLSEHLIIRFRERLTEEYIEAAQQSSLDLNEIKTEEEIYEFMKKRHLMCDFCAIRERKSMGKWLCSKGEFSEWFLEE